MQLCPPLEFAFRSRAKLVTVFLPASNLRSAPALVQFSRSGGRRGDAGATINSKLTFEADTSNGRLGARTGAGPLRTGRNWWLTDAYCGLIERPALVTTTTRG